MTLSFVCHGCGAVVDPTRAFPFACPNAGAPGGDVDHVLVAPTEARGRAKGVEDNPFLCYRQWLTPYRLARAVGLSDDAWTELVGELDLRLQRIDGRGFRVTPMARQPTLAAALGLSGDLWIKDETRNVSGSHKGRHLMGVTLYLSVLELSGLALGKDLRARRLAIASCGNAALAAAVIARAADWPLDVFIPVDAEPSVVRRLGELGATVVVCERREGEVGDPCVRAARAAVAAGAIPFSVQGPDNGLAVEGARTLAFEMAETLAAERADVKTLFVQVGGGGFASALAQGFAIAVAAGLAQRAPRLIAVQTAGCAPLARAWRRLDGADLKQAAQHRSRFMWPWESEPASLAHGVLDDETYDWWEVVKAMRETGGDAAVADEASVVRALSLARAHTAIPVSATGAAGLAGALVSPRAGRSAAAVFSGVDRSEGA
ncbi:MAG: pyridoxal-phosphate dependent enzyme, partial [Roseiarcus sp.]